MGGLLDGVGVAVADKAEGGDYDRDNDEVNHVGLLSRSETEMIRECRAGWVARLEQRSRLLACALPAKHGFLLGPEAVFDGLQYGFGGCGGKAPDAELQLGV